MQKPQYSLRLMFMLLVLAFLTMRLGALVHNTTLMSNPHLQVTASGIKMFQLSNLLVLLFLTMRPDTLVCNTTLMYNYKFVNNNKVPQAIKTCKHTFRWFSDNET